MLRPGLRAAGRVVGGWWLPLAAVAVLATGVLPLGDARAVLGRIWSILVFLVAVTVVAELADAAGLFEAAADVATRVGRGRVPALWLLVVVLATLTTVLLSLDTTAVLLTPVVLALAQRLALPPLPFAVATVWLANTASLLLPVSNLTNLLAVQRTGWSAATWAAHMWAPALACVVVTAAVLWLLTRRYLRGQYELGESPRIRHRGLLAVSGVACLGLGTAVGAGAAPWLAAVIAAVLLVAAFARADPDRLVPALVPARLVVSTVSVFALVAAAERLGLSALLRQAVDTPGDGLGQVLRVAAVGAVASNAVNNLPAYLAVEPAVASSTLHLMALVIGVNAGPLVTPWASLATLLWRERCRARGVTVNAWRLAGYGLAVTICVIGVSSAALVLTQ